MDENMSTTRLLDEESIIGTYIPEGTIQNIEQAHQMYDVNDEPPTSSSNWQTFILRCRYYIPILKWLPEYSFKQLFFYDFIAGLSVAFLIIPQALSYSLSLVHLPPIYGLYTSFMPTLIYAIFGTSKHLSVGPDALVSILTGSAITGFIEEVKDLPGYEDIESLKIMFACALSLMVGLLSLTLGLVRLGFIDCVLSRALLCGFVTAVGLVIQIEQLNTLFGLKLPMAKQPIEHLIHVIQNLGKVNPTASILSVFSIGFLISMSIMKSKFNESHHEEEPVVERPGFIAKIKKIWNSKSCKSILKNFPEMIILVTVTTLITFVFDLPIDKLGDVQGGFLLPNIQFLSKGKLVYKAFLSSILITTMGFVESIVAAKRFASRFNYNVSANRELVAFGVMNLVGSFFYSYPAFGSLSRTVVNASSGGKSQMGNLITFMIMLVTILYLLPLVYCLPKAVMSSVIFVAAVKLIELDDAYFMFKVKAYQEICMFLIGFLVTLFASIEAGVIVSIAISIILVLKHSTYPRFTLLGMIEEQVDNLATDGALPSPGLTIKKLKPLSEFPDAERLSKILMISIHEPMFFGNTGQLKERLRRLEMLGDLNVHPSEPSRLVEPIKHVIFDLENMSQIDARYFYKHYLIVAPLRYSLKSLKIITIAALKCT
jgi:MFS superfamily sulfate permease-like transporter